MQKHKESWVCQDETVGHAFNEEVDPETICPNPTNFMIKQCSLEIRTPCPECGSHPISKGISWLCPKCGRWYKKIRRT